MGVDTSIDEFFDELLQRILVVPAVAAESDPWYPPTPTETIRGPSDEVPYQRYGDIQIMARAYVFQRRDAAAKITFLQTIKAAYRYYLWLGVTDAQGRIVAATDPGIIGKDRSRMGWFKTVRERGGIHVQDAQPSEVCAGTSPL